MSDWEFSEEPKEEPRKKHAGGRPTGARNKNKGAVEIQKITRDLYEQIEHMLPSDLRDYYEEAFSGRREFDALAEGELFARLYSVYVTKVLNEAIRDDDGPTQDIAQVLGQYRMTLKDVEDIKRKREEVKEKLGDNGRLVDPTRESTLARFEGIHRKLPSST